MAKRVIEWSLNGDNGEVVVCEIDNKLNKHSFNMFHDMPAVAEVWEKMDDSEKYAVWFGYRQCLTDGCAGETTAEGKLAFIFKKHNKVFVLRELRARGPGEDKIKMKDVREKAKGLSEEEQQQAKELLAKLGINL